jgi:hypothetical protein
MEQLVILLVINYSSLWSYSIQCTQLAIRLSSTTTAATGQKTIGSETQSDLLMMGVKTPETC